MDIDNQARDSVAQDREHRGHQEATMDERAKEEVQTAARDNDTITESVRDAATSQRQAQETQKANMQYRAQEQGK